MVSCANIGFRVIEEIGAKTQIKSSSIKGFRKSVEEAYPNIYGHLDTIWPSKKDTIVTQAKVKLYAILLKFIGMISKMTAAILVHPEYPIYASLTMSSSSCSQKTSLWFHC